MKIILSYVNEEDATVDLEREFYALPHVTEWVDKHHPEWTSYDVIVVRTKEDAR